METFDEEDAEELAFINGDFGAGSAGVFDREMEKI